MIREIELKITDPRAVIPEAGTLYSAGVDLIAITDNKIHIPPLKTALIHTGIHINMMTVPENLAAFIFPRSGKGAKEGKVLGNLTGIIDKDYLGELMISVLNRNEDTYVVVEPGEKIAQLVFLPIVVPKFKIVEEFSTITTRGEGGFGSTG